MLLGFIQGVSEFLPISSSGHLAITQRLFGVGNMEELLLFDVLLHCGTLVAVIIAYRKDIMELIRAFAALFSAKGRADDSNLAARRLLLLLIIATLPLVLVILFDNLVGALGSNLVFVGFMLLCTGVLLYISDRFAKGRKTERSARVSDVLVVGLMQVLAVIPGLSRSGSTIAAGTIRGFDRKFAVKFSFLMSLPAVIGATALEVIKALGDSSLDASEILVYLPGMLVAAIAGYFSIALVRRIADKGQFGKFAVYCVTVGAVTITAVLLWK